MRKGPMFVGSLISAALIPLVVCVVSFIVVNVLGVKGPTFEIGLPSILISLAIFTLILFKNMEKQEEKDECINKRN